VKHIAQKDEMMKIIADGINKILNDKIQEVDKVYDSACQKFSVYAEMISNYLQKVEKSLQRTNIVLENSKLEKLLSVQKVIDDDIGMLQSERSQNLISSFHVQLDDTQSCLEMLSFHSTLRELADKCK
jgi:F0F1-type ATP synthase membrane subunit b/b'